MVEMVEMISSLFLFNFLPTISTIGTAEGRQPVRFVRCHPQSQEHGEVPDPGVGWALGAGN